MTSTWRRSLAALIDSDSDDGGLNIHHESTSAMHTASPESGSYESHANSKHLQSSLRSPLFGYPYRAARNMTHITGVNLDNSLKNDSQSAPMDKAGRIFASLFPDDSDDDMVENPQFHLSQNQNRILQGTTPTSAVDSQSRGDQHPVQLTDSAHTCTGCIAPTSDKIRAHLFDAGNKPSLDVISTRPEEPIVLYGKDDIPDASIPGSAARYLKDYQVAGVNWMWNKYLNKQGGILGDDMGLGKTIQVIALLLAMFGKTGSPIDITANRKKRKIGFLTNRGNPHPPPCLIICPASVVTNWGNELNKWGYFLIEELGSYDDVSAAVNKARDGRCDVVLGSYAKLRRNIDDICVINWSCIIWDEGHCLKGDNTQLYKACEKLVRTRCKFILSGTPVQNRLEELWALLNILNKGVVHSKESFKGHFVQPIKFGEARNAHPEAVALGNKRQKELQNLVGKYMLQRFKEVELRTELKSKDDIVVFCALSSLQRRMYKHLLSLPDYDNCRYSKHPCPCGSGNSRRICCNQYRVPLRADSNYEINPSAYGWRKCHRSPDKAANNRSNNLYCKFIPDAAGGTTLIEEYESCDSCPTCMSLSCIQTLLKVASHPLLFQLDASSKDSDKNEDKMNFLKYCFTSDMIRDMGGPKFVSGSALSGEKNRLSGKMLILEKILENFTKMRFKTLLFSYSTKMLSIIENYVRSQGWAYLRLDGSTPGIDRQGLVDRFNNTPDLPIFLISTRAGGMGLNLTSATKVIIYDCSWNPTMDMQAQDRCYRYGQTKQVTVYRLIAQGTVEELVYMRQLYKQAMQNTAVPSRPELAAEKDALEEAGITVNSSQDDVVDPVPSDYTAKRKRIGEGKRAFCGIEKGPNGELFGLENLLQYEDESILGMLRKKYNLEREVIESDEDDEINACDKEVLPSAAHHQLKTLSEAAVFNVLAEMNSNFLTAEKEIESNEQGTEIDTSTRKVRNGKRFLPSIDIEVDVEQKSRKVTVFDSDFFSNAEVGDTSSHNETNIEIKKRKVRAGVDYKLGKSKGRPKAALRENCIVSACPRNATKRSNTMGETVVKLSNNVAVPTTEPLLYKPQYMI